MDEPKDDFLPHGEPEGDLPDWPGEPVELDEHDARGIADHEAGRTISNAAVMRWLKSIVDGKPIPRPQIGD